MQNSKVLKLEKQCALLSNDSRPERSSPSTNLRSENLRMKSTTVYRIFFSLFKLFVFSIILVFFFINKKIFSYPHSNHLKMVHFLLIFLRILVQFFSSLFISMWPNWKNKLMLLLRPIINISPYYYKHFKYFVFVSQHSTEGMS